MGFGAQPAQAAVRVVIIQGLGGDPGYVRQFGEQAAALAKISQALAPAEDIWLWSGQDATRARILAGFQRLSGQLHADDRLILYLIGHGSFDGRQYKFNLPGPDLSDADLARLLNALPTREQLVVATGSCSGALLSVLAAPHRVLLTATRNGEEKNITRFGAALVSALRSNEADTDKDSRISLPEAYAFANRQVQDAYRHDTLLATEHAVLQGDEAKSFLLAGLGAAAGEGAGLQAGQTAGAGAAGSVPADWLRRRDTLNERIGALEAKKATLASDDYQRQLQALLLQLAQLQQRIDQGGADRAPPP
jgi:hypothetical protein